jgi:ATP-dependent helicase/nuclease subunit A
MRTVDNITNHPNHQKHRRCELLITKTYKENNHQMSNNLTNEQRQALTLDKNISVTAGAGSGKTKILTDRFLKIALQNPHRVKNILAITFTNKAAGEMMERIVTEVEKRLQKAETKNDKLKLHQIREQLNSTYISTIHTFCSKILREFPIEAGIQPDFNIIEEIRNIVFKSRTVKYAFDWLNSLDKDSAVYEEWIHLFTTISLKNIKDLLNKALSNPFEMEKISALYEKFDYEDYQKFLEKYWLKSAEKCAGKTDADNIHKTVKNILTLDRETDKNDKGLKVLETMRLFKEIYQSAPYSSMMFSRLFDLVDTFTTKGKAYKTLNGLGNNASWSKEVKQELIGLSALCVPIAEKLKRFKPGNFSPETDRRWFSAFKTFLRLYNFANNKYNEIKREQNVLDYEDLQILTIHLLQKNNEVYQKIQNRFDYIMVDEFQDTNPLQWEIIKLLIENQKDKLFVVGDPKQSVYGFRNADIRIFNDAKERFADGYENMEDYPGNVVFCDSFRFLPRLNAFINHIFSNTLRESPDNPYEVGYHALNPKRELPGKGWVELALIDAGDPLQSEEEYIAYRINKLIGGKSTCFIYEQNEEREKEIKYGHIAILLRSRTHLLKLEETLRRNGIPFKTIGGIGFWQRQEIYDFYYLLRFLSNPADDLALIAVLRAKFFMISDRALFLMAQEEETTYLEKLNSGFKKGAYYSEDKNMLENARNLINKWLALKERIGLADLLKIIINDTRLRTILLSELNGEQLAANVDKLIELADAFDSGGLGGLQDFLANINELINRETKEGDAAVDVEDEETVKIMTIHASKGLQFPVVFLPYLNPQNRGNSDSVFIDPSLGIAAAVKKPETDENIPHTLLHLLKTLIMEKDAAEKKRLFYVAATRASNYLFMSADYKEKINENSPLDWLSRQIDIEDNNNNFKEFDITIINKYTNTQDDNASAAGKDKLINQLIQSIDGLLPDKNKIPPHLLPPHLTQPSQTFSATKIMVYLQDKEEYYRRYHLGFFENDYETFAKDVYESDHHLLRGSIVHKYLELKDHSTNDDALLDKILADFDIFDAELAQHLKDDVQRLYEKMTHSPLGGKIINVKESRNEAVITARIGNDYFTGAIDRLILNDENLWEVVDYKTNKIEEEELDKEAKKYEWQIKSYALFVSRLYPEQGSYPISFYFLEIDRMYRVSFNRNEINEIEKEFMQIIADIKRDFPVKL